MIHYPPTDLICIRLLPVRLLPPLRPFRLPIFHPHPLHIHPVLFAPPLVHPWPWYPLRHQTQIHNGTCHNKLCNCVMAAGDVGLHLLQSRLHHSLLYRGYLHTPSLPRRYFLPIRLWATLWWNPPNTLPMRGLFPVFLHVPVFFFLRKSTDSPYSDIHQN